MQTVNRKLEVLTVQFKLEFFFSKRTNLLTDENRPRSFLNSTLTLLTINTFKVKIWKELSLNHKLKFSNPYIVVTWWTKPLIFQTWFDLIKFIFIFTLGCKEICIRKSVFVAKTEFLCWKFELQENDSGSANSIITLVFNSS